MRAALYTRVSTRDKGQEAANQVNQLREFCAAQGWPIANEYEDHESGGKADRAQFRAMMTDAAKREFDVLVFWALDRFSREGVYETHLHLKRLDDAGVRFRSFSEPYLDSCGMFRDAVISILAVIAKQERIRISERVRSGLSRARAKERAAANPSAGPGSSSIEAKRSSFETWEDPGGILRVHAVWASRPFVAHALQWPVPIQGYQDTPPSFGRALSSFPERRFTRFSRCFGYVN